MKSSIPLLESASCGLATSLNKLKDMRILIVDDDSTNRKLLLSMLEDNCDCDEAVNGKEAVELVKERIEKKDIYDVIFLDIKMPVMNGHETLLEIRKIEEQNQILIGEGSKIVMVSALSDQQNIISAFREGCEYYLVKPFQQNKLYQLMNEMGYCLT